MRAIRLIAAVTPTNADAGSSSALNAIAPRPPDGKPRRHHDEKPRRDHDEKPRRDHATDLAIPAWTYARRDVTEIEDALAVLSRAVRTWDVVALRSLYSCTYFEEMALETALARTAGTPAFAALAAKRFPTPFPSPTPTPSPSPTPTPSPSPLVATDSEDPRSLLSQVRGGGLRQRRVLFLPSRSPAILATLAATGEKHRVRAARAGIARRPPERAARRIAIHGLARARRSARAGRAHASDLLRSAWRGGAADREGLALFYEEPEVALMTIESASLARRAYAATLMRAGADFVDATARPFADEHFIA